MKNDACKKQHFYEKIFTKYIIIIINLKKKKKKHQKKHERMQKQKQNKLSGIKGICKGNQFIQNNKQEV